MERLHTREVAYYLLAVGALALSAVFSYRAAIVYYQLLLPKTNEITAMGFAILIFFALTIGEFVASTHWGSVGRNILVIGIVFLHDAAGVFYTIYGGNDNVQNTIDKAKDMGAATGNLSNLFLFVGMTAITFLPFIFGHWMQELAQHVAADRKIRHANWVNSFSYRLEHKAAKVYWKWAKKDAETLRKFAPVTIRQYVEGAMNTVVIENAEQAQIDVPNENAIDPTIITLPEKKPFRWFWQKKEEDPIQIEAPKQQPKPGPEKQFTTQAQTEKQLRAQYPEDIEEIELPQTPSMWVQEDIPDENYEYEDPDTDPEREAVPVVPFGVRVGKLTKKIWGSRSEAPQAPAYNDQNPWAQAHQDAIPNRSSTNGTHSRYRHSEW